MIKLNFGLLINNKKPNMKSLKLTLILFSMIVFLSQTKAQNYRCPECVEILDNKLVETSEYGSTSEYEDELYELFEMDEKEFDKTTKDTDGNIKVSFVYKKLPIDLGLGGSKKRTYQYLKEIRKKIQRNQNISKSDIAFFKKRSSKEMFDAFNDCMKSCYLNNKIPSGIKGEVIGDQAETFIYSISWQPISANQQYTFIQNVALTNLIPIGERTISKGEILEIFTGISQSYQRVDKTKQASIVINLNGQSPLMSTFQPVKPGEEKRKILSSMPLGTIITSAFDYDNFCIELYGQQCDPSSTEWVLADGSSAFGTEFMNVVSDPSRNTVIDETMKGGKLPDFSGKSEFGMIEKIKSVAIGHDKRIHNEVLKGNENSLQWNWTISPKRIMGNRRTTLIETDVDEFDISIIKDGNVDKTRVIGRTWDWKDGDHAGNWRGGTANLYGIGVRKQKVYYYVKVR